MFDLYLEPTDHPSIFISNDGYHVDGEVFESFESALDFVQNFR